jgi:dipeptidyl aminopeptidase/acylaminoacyl peptidase
LGRVTTDKEGPIVQDWRWLPDSSEVVFLERINGERRLMIAHLRTKKIKELAAGAKNIKAFDIRDPRNFVYTAADPTEIKKHQDQNSAELHGSAIVGTGRSLGELIMPDDPVVVRRHSPRACLWAVLDGMQFEVKHDGEQVVPEGNPALSPDGHSVVTILPVPNVPKSWETLYPPPFASSGDRIHSGHLSTQQYVRIDLRTGSVQSLTNAPTSGAAGWWAEGSPDWSNDGQEVLLPGTFLDTSASVASRPCVAAVNLVSDTRTCIEVSKARTETSYEEGFHVVSSVHFVNGDKHSVAINFSLPDGTAGSSEYLQMSDGKWQKVGQSQGQSKASHGGLEVSIKQAINEPPLLVASDEHTSRVLWDPNPQLKNIDLGQASLYLWKDKQGRQFKGGLYKPVGYKAGQRYPLVIQTHGYDGFNESFFSPPGGEMPTGFAARALAAAGILVLQVDENCPFGTPEEGPCAVSAYESGTNSLVSDGLVDPTKIGVIGFSRSCFYVMEAITASSLQIRTASITSGLMFDYWQSMFTSEGDSIIGAPPFGKGLQQWLKRSPGFNLDKVNAPLMVVGEGPYNLLAMWAPYAGLRYLHKPVDLIMLNTDEHTLTNPAMRIASQGGSVDWFRFWLQGYEDPDPAKADQYKRWRELKKLQEENATNQTGRSASN